MTNELRGKKNGCIESHRRNRHGYGVFKYKGVDLLAHRVSWMLHHGRIPKGMFVCHKCDNPPCINPDHLFLGTCKDNMMDAVRKGRMNKWNGRRRGDKNPKARLTLDEVKAIRENKDKLTQEALGERYGVSQVTVSDIINKITWR